jgi:hypothetical protein
LETEFTGYGKELRAKGLRLGYRVEEQGFRVMELGFGVQRDGFEMEGL